MKIIVGEFALKPADFDVTISSGVITLTGLAQKEQTALELVARIRHVEGVVPVRDRLGFDKPIA
jgi:BON domain